MQRRRCADGLGSSLGFLPCEARTAAFFLFRPWTLRLEARRDREKPSILEITGRP